MNHGFCNHLLSLIGDKICRFIVYLDTQLEAG